MEEDRRAVLAAEVPSLSIRGGRVVDRPEHTQQLVKANPRGVKPHVDRLGVTGPVRADLLVRGVDRRAAGVADARPHDPFDLAERGFDAPEAAGRERRVLQAIGRAARLRGAGARRGGGVGSEVEQGPPFRFSLYTRFDPERWANGSGGSGAVQPQAPAQEVLEGPNQRLGAAEHPAVL